MRFDLMLDKELHEYSEFLAKEINRIKEEYGMRLPELSGLLDKVHKELHSRDLTLPL